MESSTRDAGAAWYLAAVQATEAGQAAAGGPPYPDDEPRPNVIIAVSLDELDGMAGDMLV
jgi:hypothetical protein